MVKTTTVVFSSYTVTHCKHTVFNSLLMSSPLSFLVVITAVHFSRVPILTLKEHLFLTHPFSITQNH